MNLPTTFFLLISIKGFFIFHNNKVRIEMLAGVYQHVTMLTHYL